ncbi:hypothetical protein HJ588_12205 [Flexivirga sp. ID2601S]|uniref:Anti-sigma-D factor RsdA sigma factor binding region domain-containing protein n=1 Tax=Flexivirga aerilata TaxID=1656889 RepID=A0A849AHU6_9MICO|nr:hypothetical protein [Flexivirga aerilata]
MSPPSIGDIRRDDELLDALGARREVSSGDEVAALLGDWVAQVDAPPRAKRGGRYARARRGSARIGVTAAVVVGALSMSGMAAAVTGVPGISRVAQNFGLAGRSAPTAIADGPAGHPAGTSQPDPAVTGTEQPSAPPTVRSTTAVSARSSASTPADRTTGRVMPGTPEPSMGVWVPSPTRIVRGGPVLSPTATAPATSPTSLPASTSSPSATSSSSMSPSSSSSSSSSPSSSSSHTPRASRSATSTSQEYFGPTSSPRGSARGHARTPLVTGPTSASSSDATPTSTSGSSAESSSSTSGD